jgi:hypothetical protein
MGGDLGEEERSQLHTSNAGTRVGIQQLNTSLHMQGYYGGEEPAAYIQCRCQGRLQKLAIQLSKEWSRSCYQRRGDPGQGTKVEASCHAP